MRRDVPNSHHLATVSYDGRFWDAYLELVESPGPNQPARGRIAFSAADIGDIDPVRTTTIFIEATAQEVVTRAREFKTHQLVALLRSAIPPDWPQDREPQRDADDHPPERPASELPPDVPGADAAPDQGEAADAP